MRVYHAQTLHRRSHAMFSCELLTLSPACVTVSATGEFVSRSYCECRDSCFDSTLIHLTERFHGKDVYIVGTCNQSTLLATRTKKLIEELKPDTVIVQTTPQWWGSAKSLKYVESQEEMNQYHSRLDRYLSEPEKGYAWFPMRHWLQQLRIGSYTYFFRKFFGFDNSFAFYKPGLEIKYACEAAEKVGARIQYLGAELDTNSWNRLKHETPMNWLNVIWTRFAWAGSRWIHENGDNSIKLDLVGPAAFTEKCMD